MRGQKKECLKLRSALRLQMFTRCPNYPVYQPGAAAPIAQPTLGQPTRRGQLARPRLWQNLQLAAGCSALGRWCILFARLMSTVAQCAVCSAAAGVPPPGRHG